ncbi:MAG: TRAM domain-containing protein [Candidatus Hydrothermarchaeales archaeon]
MQHWNDYQSQTSEAPVHEGELYNVKIEAMGRDGDGIARVNGFVIFVPHTKMGDELTIKITKVARSVAFAESSEAE